MALISIINGIDARQLREMPYSKVKELINDALQELNKVGDTKKTKIKDTYQVGPYTCELVQSINDMTAIQYADLIFMIRAANENNSLEAQLHVILSILLVPKGKHYPHYDKMALSEAILNNLEAEDAFAISNFIEGISLGSHDNTAIFLALNRMTMYVSVPGWRRKLAMWMVKILLTPSPKLLRQNGAL